MPLPFVPDPDALPHPTPLAPPRPDPTAIDAIAAVVELLDPAERLIGQAVAVGDGELDAPALAQITDSSAMVVVGALDVLAHVGLVRRTPDGRVIAAHAHVRAVLLGSLDRAGCAELHAQIALALAGRNVDGSVIAAHIDASGVPELARWGVELATAAGRAAADVGDHGRAQDAFARADRLNERAQGIPASARWR